MSDLLKTLLEDATLLEASFNDIKSKYKLIRGPKYHDSNDVQWVASNSKGKKAFDIDVSATSPKEYTVTAPNHDRKVFKDLNELSKYLDDKAPKWMPDDAVPSDEEIAKWVAKETMVKQLKQLDKFKHTGYIVWGNDGVQVRENGDDELPQFPWLVFKNGDRMTDESAGLGAINMTTKEFIEWLKKHGSKEMKKPQRSRSSSYYD